MSFNRKPLQKNHTSTVHADLKELELHWRLKIGVVRGASKLYLRYHTGRCMAIFMKFTLGATPPPSQQPNTTCYHQCISGTVKCLHSLWSLHRFWHSLSCLGCGGRIQTFLVLRCESSSMGSARVPLSLFYMLLHSYHFDIRESFQNNAANVFRVGKTFWFPIHDSHHLQGAKLLQSLIWSPAWSGSSWSSW